MDINEIYTEMRKLLFLPAILLLASCFSSDYPDPEVYIVVQYKIVHDTINDTLIINDTIIIHDTIMGHSGGALWQRILN